MKKINFDNILSSIKGLNLEEKEHLYNEFTKILSTTEFSSQHSYNVFKMLINLFEKYEIDPTNKNILEIGSGKYSLFTGLLWLSEKVDSYIGIDKYCEPFFDEFWKKIYAEKFDSIILKNENLKNILKRNSWSDLSKYISIYGGDVCDLEIKENSIDFCYSMAVFEHIENPELAIRRINKSMKIGGFSYHNIDLRPHRGNKETPVTILKYDENEWKNMMQNTDNWIYLNRLRKSDWIRLFEKNGFEIVYTDSKKFPIKINEEIISEIHPAFRKYSICDLETSILNIFVKKSGEVK